MLLYTIGHSNHSQEVLIDWLRSHGITQLVDIRRHPGSRRLPQFNQGTLRHGLTTAGIDYHWQGESLGGMREPADTSTGFDALPAGAFRAFATHMNSAAFRAALAECLALAASSPTAIMCAERSPLHCHRQLISDYLVLQGHDVRHITGVDEVTLHEVNPAARLEEDRIFYDRGTQPELGL